MAQRPPSYQERNTYIPPSVKTAMDQHAQQSMPAHLKQYAGGDKYIPQHAQAAMSQHMEKSMPGHLKQYAGAYMQQKTYESNSRPVRANAQFNPVAPPTPYKPVNYLPRDAHYHQYGDPTQINTQPGPPAPDQPNQLPVQPGGTVSPGNYPVPPAQAQPPQPATPAPQSGYEFIMNPVTPPRKSWFAASSKLIQFGLIGGGLVVSYIIFSVVRGIFSTPSILPAYVGIAQDQAELIHLATNASQQKDLTLANQNFVATANLTLPSNQAELLELLAKSNAKVDPKGLGAKISPVTDQRLADAAAATTYNQTFKEIMQAALKSYMSDMKQTYDKTTGQAGRDLLGDQYNQAELLLKQLNTAVTAPAAASTADN